MGLKSPSQILNGAHDSLRTASTGLQEMREKSEDLYLGLKTVIVFGSSTLDILRQLDEVLEGFVDWRAGWMRQIKEDQVTAALLSMRDHALKRVLTSNQIDQRLSTVSDAGSYIDMAEHYLRVISEMLTDLRSKFGSQLN